MYIFSKINLRRIFTICLICVTLFVGSVTGIGYQDQAFAVGLERDAQGLLREKPLNDAEYESAKANRSKLQAERSKQASEEYNSKSVSKKLNLNEIAPSKVKNALDDKK